MKKILVFLFLVMALCSRCVIADVLRIQNNTDETLRSQNHDTFIPNEIEVGKSMDIPFRRPGKIKREYIPYDEYEHPYTIEEQEQDYLEREEEEARDGISLFQHLYSDSYYLDINVYINKSSVRFVARNLTDPEKGEMVSEGCSISIRYEEKDLSKWITHKKENKQDVFILNINNELLETISLFGYNAEKKPELKYEKSRLKIVNSMGSPMDIYLHPYDSRIKEIVHIDTGDSKIIDLKLPLIIPAEAAFGAAGDRIRMFGYVNNDNRPSTLSFELEATVNKEREWNVNALMSKEVIYSCGVPNDSGILYSVAKKITEDEKEKPLYIIELNNPLLKATTLPNAGIGQKSFYEYEMNDEGKASLIKSTPLVAK